MRVLFTIKTLVHSVGGAERMVASLTGVLAQRGLDVHVLTFDRAGEPPFFKVDSRVPLHTVNTLSTAQKTGIFEMPMLLWRLRREVLRIKPDVIIAFMHSTFVAVQMALLGTGIKVIFSEHTAPAYYQTRRGELWLMRLFSFFAYRITIVSEQIRDLYPAEMQTKMDILPDPVSSDFQPADVIGANCERKVILSVGRLNKDKDHRILIEAFYLISGNLPDWDLKIVGEGEERGPLERLIMEHGLQSRIFLPGVCSDMDSVYKSAQIFVLPSRYESFGLATAEAMSHSLPVIGFSDCSGTRELIGNEQNGYLLESRTKEALAEAIMSLSGSSSLRKCFGQNGHAKSLQFGMESVAQVWHEYIGKL